MGRASLVVKETELKSAIATVESNGPFANFGALCEAVANTDWAKQVRNTKHQIRGLQPQMVGIKIKEYNVECLTKPGKKGRQAGQAITKTSRSDKVKKLKIEKFAEKLLGEVTSTDKNPVPDKYMRLAQQALEGSPVAAIKLQCGACMGYTGDEKACDGALGGTPCPLYVMNRLCYSSRRKFVTNEDGFMRTELLKAIMPDEDS